MFGNCNNKFKIKTPKCSKFKSLSKVYEKNKFKQSIYF